MLFYYKIPHVHTFFKKERRIGGQSMPIIALFDYGLYYYLIIKQIDIDSRYRYRKHLCLYLVPLSMWVYFNRLISEYE